MKKKSSWPIRRNDTEKRASALRRWYIDENNLLNILSKLEGWGESAQIHAKLETMGTTLNRQAIGYVDLPL
jgi:hypothetical protein